MNVALIGFLAFGFIGMTLLNRIAEGALVASGEFNILSNLSMFSSMKILNLFSIPIINFNFFTNGLPHLVRWDYSFFGGNAAIVQYFLYSLTAMLAFGLFVIVIIILWGYASKLT